MKKWNMIRWILGIPVIVLTLILVILICEPEKSELPGRRLQSQSPLLFWSPGRTKKLGKRIWSVAFCSR